MKNKQYIWKNSAILLAVIAIEIICTYFYPITGDDRYFQSLNIVGMKECIHYLKVFGNGRYLGNLLVVFLVNNRMLRTLIKTICVVGIWMSLIYLCNVKEIWKKSILAILVLFPSNLLAAQVYVWTAGFCNYVVCVCLELTAISCLKKANETKNIYVKVLLTLVLIFSVFLAQLCSENSTVINVMIAMIVLIITIKNNKKIIALIFVISTALGTGLMFLGPKYFHVAYKMKGYRQVPTTIKSIVSTIIYNTLTINRSMLGNFCLFLVLTGAILFLYADSRKYIKYYFSGFAIYSFLYFIMDNDREWVYSNYLFRNIISITVFGIYIILIFMTLYKNKKMVNNKIWLVFYLLIFSIAPLLFVQPIGARTLYYTYILFITFTMQILNHIVISEKAKNIISEIVNIFLMVFLVCNVIMWSNIHYADNLREKYIKEKMEVGEKQINIPALPKQDFLWNDTMINNSLDCLYKYNKQGDIKFKIQNWDNWYEENFLNKDSN